jgi:hypothetical protein
VLCTLWWGLVQKDTSFMLGPMVPEFLFYACYDVNMIHTTVLIFGYSCC